MNPENPDKKNPTELRKRPLKPTLVGEPRQLPSTLKIILE